MIQIISAARDSSLNGPLDTPAIRYPADRDDPHLRAGMYSGLTGAADRLIVVFKPMAGVQLNLHDFDQPAVVVRPCLPATTGGRMPFQHLVSVRKPANTFGRIPFWITVKPAAGSPRVCINGRTCPAPMLGSLDGVRSLNVEVSVQGSPAHESRRTSTRTAPRVVRGSAHSYRGRATMVDTSGPRGWHLRPCGGW